MTSSSDVTLFTTSYGGGTNLDSTTTPAGGFQPNLTLFDASGLAVAFPSGMASPIGNTDSTTGLNLDAYINDPSLSSGTYYAILTEVDNQVSASFTGFGSTLPSSFYTLFSGPGGTDFSDVQGNARSGAYALNIEASPLSVTTTPEPSTLWLVILAGFGVIALRRRHSSTI